MKLPYLLQVDYRIGSTHDRLIRLVYADSEAEAEAKLEAYMNRMYQKAGGFELLDMESLTI